MESKVTPFLRLKWKMNEQAKIKDAYFKVRSIKEIIQKKDETYDKLLEAVRKEIKPSKP